jgi:hypothetical protein
LRAAAHEALWLDDAQLRAWLRRPLDTSAVIRAHGHVTATRAGVEADLSRRKLETGALRTFPVWTEHRDGTRRVFAAAEGVPRALAQACADLQRVPEHPFIRAAWVSQALGVVHPFRDANGGTARFLASLELARASLPPFILSFELRNGAYIEALAIREGLDPLALVVYEAVQQQLATALLSGRAREGVSENHSAARAERWDAVADEVIRAKMGRAAAPAARAGGNADDAMTRLTRSGVRMTAVPAPRIASWTVGTPVPARVDLAIFELRGGPTHWLGAAVIGRAGEYGELGSWLERQHVATYFVAPGDEPDAIVDARFHRWLDTRVEQIVRGLARWM